MQTGVQFLYPRRQIKPIAELIHIEGTVQSHFLKINHIFNA
jgi:hypothetical protein